MQVGQPDFNEGTLSVSCFDIICKECTLVGSLTGPRGVTNDMIKICVDKNIYPIVEEFSFDDLPKAFDKLENTKENLFKQQDLTQWGLSQTDLENKMALLGNKDYAFSKMLPKETKRVNMFKAFYGGYLNSIIGEYERLRFLNAKRHKDNINIYIRKLSDCITDFHVSLADRLTEFSEMKEEDNSQPVQLDKNEIIEEPEQKDVNKNNA